MDPEYKKVVFPDACPSHCKQWKESPKDCACRQKMQAALDQAHKIRQFEIELYWRRSLYFWGFQAIFFTAYALILAEYKPEGASDSAPIIAIALLGLVVSILWYFLEKGSKAWQENWEHHIDQLEDNFTGRLHKTVLGEAKNFYSVTRINKLFIIAIGYTWSLFFILPFCCYGLLCSFTWSLIMAIILAFFFGCCDKKDSAFRIKSSFPRNKHWETRKKGEGIGENEKINVYYRWRGKSRN